MVGVYLADWSEVYTQTVIGSDRVRTDLITSAVVAVDCDSISVEGDGIASIALASDHIVTCRAIHSNSSSVSQSGRSIGSEADSVTLRKIALALADFYAKETVGRNHVAFACAH